MEYPSAIKKCSKCGSLSNEYFQKNAMSGIRCLHCGHEQIKRIQRDCDFDNQPDNQPYVLRTLGGSYIPTF